MSEPEPSVVDVRALMAEIRDEADRLRSTGAVPPALEADLDAAFAELAPAGAVAEDFDALLDKVERAAFVDTAAPTASNLPAGRVVKQSIRRLVGWNLEHIARQVTAFHHAVVSAVRQLDTRVTRLERATPVAGLASPPASADTGRLRTWAGEVADRLAGVEGRILHAECGDGWLVTALAGRGLDAYGIDPDRTAVPMASEVELRVDDPLDHLDLLPASTLGGLVLSGLVDRLPVAALASLVPLARVKIRPGGRLVVIASDPRTWVTATDPVAADLAPGRPLAAQTWAHLLTAAGFGDVSWRAGDVDDVVGEPVDGSLRRVAELALGHGSHLVVGTRPA